MQQYNAIIIDDEPNNSEALGQMLTHHCPEINVVGLADSASKGRELLASSHIEFIFLDIAMPIEDGFAFLNSIDSEKYGIIFITAYQEYALSAFKANAIDYLLKPINHIELKESVQKAIRYYIARHINRGFQTVYQESLANMLKQMNSGAQYMSKVTIKGLSGFRILNLDDLIYMKADSNYTEFHLKDEDMIVATRSLGEYEGIINHPHFLRIHKSTIINLNYLKAYNCYQGNFAELTDGTRLSISRRRMPGFLEAVKRFSGNIE